MDSMFSIVNGVRYYNLALAQRKVAELKEAGESVLWIFNGKMQAESRIFFNAKEMAVPVEAGASSGRVSQRRLSRVGH